MIEALHTDYSVRQICEVLGFNRSSLYYQPKTDPFEQRLRDEIEKLSARYPTYGYRRIAQLLLRMGYDVGYRRVARLMKAANLLVPVKPACQTTQSLRGLGQWVNRVDNLDICRRNQVWVGDITYVPTQRTIRLCFGVNGCIHPNDKRVAVESILDRTAHIETITTRIKPKRSRDSPQRPRGSVSFNNLYFYAHRSWN